MVGLSVWQMKRNKSDTGFKARYIKVPLPMFRLLIKDKRKISDVIAYGVYLRAMAQDVSAHNADLQLLYAYFHQESNNERVHLTQSLKNKLEKLDNELGLTDEDYGGFLPSNCGRFDPEAAEGNAVNLIKEKLQQDSDFANEVMEFHALRQVADLLNFERLDVEKTKQIHEKYQRFDNDVFAYANIDIMFKYLNDIDQKTDDDIACLLMYMAYKSILGDKDLARANKELVLARMVGAKGRDELESILTKQPHAKQFYDRYSSVDTFKRIRKLVCKYKFIPRIETIPGRPGLGTFVSCDRKLSDKKFAEKIKKFVDDERKQKNRDRVNKYRAKYNQKSEASKYLAEMFGTSSDSKISNAPPRNGS